ncbi:hypothetical protein V6N11_025010 [Hibiscus sabdariffa]|uniref:Bifunctional inhibitor/plant lipid transfer protein/seed storage helical domain-containing protein n=1 Tax=Hibiscus sabdariffa TaxID=183260 RepID=A0ABR2QNT8_9ROSI
MCASIKFLAILIFLTPSGFTRISVVSANREVIRLVAPHRTLMNDKTSPPRPNSDLLTRYFNVLSLLSPCLPFVKDKDSESLPECCENVKIIAEERKNKQDEQNLCLCIKYMWQDHGPFDSKRLPLVGKACHIDFYIPPIDGKTNCSLIAWEK